MPSRRQPRRCIRSPTFRCCYRPLALSTRSAQAAPAPERRCQRCACPSPPAMSQGTPHSCAAAATDGSQSKERWIQRRRPAASSRTQRRRRTAALSSFAGRRRRHGISMGRMLRERKATARVGRTWSRMRWRRAGGSGMSETEAIGPRDRSRTRRAGGISNSSCPYLLSARPRAKSSQMSTSASIRRA